MSSPPFPALLSVVLVSVLPLFGVFFLFIREDLIRKSILFFVSFSTGALLGDVFLHMVPEMREGRSFTVDLRIILVGIVVSFAIEKTIHWRHCHVLPGGPDDHGHECHHHPVGMLTIFADAMHNFIDGLVIAGSYAVSIPVGIATTLAVVFHEIPQEIGNIAILLHSGYSRRNSILFNLYSQTAAILGAALFLFASSRMTGLTDVLLPFAAGNFLYIAGSDLIPELHKDTGMTHALLQVFFMVCGILVMFGLTLVE